MKGTLSMQCMWFFFIWQTAYVKWKYPKLLLGNNLKNVILIHTGKIYQCNLYRKVLTQKGNVKQHELIHTGENHISVTFVKSFLRNFRWNSIKEYTRGRKSIDIIAVIKVFYRNMIWWDNIENTMGISQIKAEIVINVFS